MWNKLGGVNTKSMNKLIIRILTKLTVFCDIK